MRHPFLIGTAGHVDHGKTTLVRALTGVDTDRLAEEKKRGLSIDLGFAEFRLPSGRTAGIVDVPGHERFLKNMLAGAAGVDFGLLVVAADEGMMPQTREHLAILEALRVPRGVIAMTKADTVEADWLALVEADVREAMANSFLADAPLVAVDSLTGRGLTELAARLDAAAEALPEPAVERAVFLPVDRVFVRPGFGAVVTGSLRAGILREGDPVTVYPSGRPARVRGLQTFGQRENVAEAGMRTAVNLAGVDANELARGDVIAPSGSLSPSDRMNVILELAADTRPLKHRSRVRVHLGTAELLARVLLWESAELAPGERAPAQLHLERPGVARRGDRFVARWYSPQDLLGGGTVIEPAAAPFRARDAQVATRLRALEAGDPADIARQALSAAGVWPQTAAQVSAATGLPEPDTLELLSRLSAEGAARETPAGFVDITSFAALRDRWTARLAAYHKKNPLRPGIPRAELRAREMPAFAFDALLATLRADGTLVVEQDAVRLPDFAIRLRPEQEHVVAEILPLYQQAGWQPPAENEVTRSLGPHRATRELWDYLAATGRLIAVGDGLYLHPDTANAGIAALRNLFHRDGEVTVGAFRDAVSASRRAAVPFLEWCDTRRLTRREGDTRVPGPAL